MSAQENRELIQRYFQQIHAGFYAEDAELHDVSQAEPLRGRDAIEAFLRIYLHEAFPDGAYEVHSVVADDERVAVEWTFRGTNTGPAMGVPPTGRRVRFPGASVYEVREGAIARARIYYDRGTVAAQLGLTGEPVPPEEQGRWFEWWRSTARE